MIQKNNQEVTAIHHQNKTIAAVYKAGRVIWQAIRSCFGAGYWVGDKPWLGDEAWKN